MAKDRKLKKFAEINALRHKHDQIPSLIKKVEESYRNGKLEEVCSTCVEILRMQPENYDALHFLALYSAQTKHYAEALELFVKCIKLKPSNPTPYLNLAPCLIELGRYRDAVECCKKSLSMGMEIPIVYDNMAKALNELEESEKAIECLRKAIKIAKIGTDAQLYNNLGICLQRMNRIDEAEEAYRKSLSIKSDSENTHWNLFQALALKGDYKNALPEIEWRPQQDPLHYMPSPKPLPDISEPNGGRLFITPEQGLGDCIHFARFIPIYAKFFGSTVFHCPLALIRVLGTMPGIGILVPREDVPEKSIPHDYRIYLMSVANELNKRGLFQINDEAYLKADEKLAEKWREEMDLSKFNIGIVWAGNQKHKNDRNRSIDPLLFADLAGIENVEFYSIQKGNRADALPELASRMKVINAGAKITDLASTAALMVNLDLVISVDSAPLHLAGALGVRTWGLIPFAPDWRWMTGKDDSIWYKSLKLFRQQRPGDWTELFKRVRQELTKLAALKKV